MRKNRPHLTEERSSSNDAKHFFNRIVNIWNSLPGTVYGSTTDSYLKNELDKLPAVFVNCNVSQLTNHMSLGCKYCWLTSFGEKWKSFKLFFLSYRISKQFLHSAFCYFFFSGRRRWNVGGDFMCAISFLLLSLSQYDSHKQPSHDKHICCCFLFTYYFFLGGRGRGRGCVRSTHTPTDSLTVQINSCS